MARYLILGAGKFGRLALERLARQDDEASFLVVDESSQALAVAQALFNNNRLHVVKAEAVAFLLKFLKEDPGWDWTVPMVPVHVAFQWLWQGPLAGLGWHLAEVPEAVENWPPTPSAANMANSTSPGPPSCARMIVPSRISVP